jgi:hypothetical protein
LDWGRRREGPDFGAYIGAAFYTLKRQFYGIADGVEAASSAAYSPRPDANERTP